MRHGNFIPNDGYTEPGYVAAAPRLHGALRFQFRPCLPETQARFFRKLDEVKKDAKEQCIATFVAERLTQWDLVNDKLEEKDQKPLEIRALNVLHLHPTLFDKLYGVVSGLRPSDEDPQWDEELKQEKAGEQFESALSDKTVGQVTAEKHEKNSGLG